MPSKADILLRAEKPDHIPVHVAGVPAALAALPQWILWRWHRKDGRWTKLPIDAQNFQFAKSNDPATWTDFGTARLALDRGVRTRAADGLGFVFAKGGGLVGIDLDDCRNPDTGDLDDTAQAHVSELATYCEVSPTGTGVKLFGRGDVPAGLPKKKGHVEVYCGGRFFTVTGRRHGPVEQVGPVAGEALAALFDFPPHPAPRRDTRPPTRPPERPAPGRPLTVLPAAVRRPVPVKLLRLWQGDWTGFPSQSEADLSLLGYLAKYANGDRATLDGWFRNCGLMRPKWDEVHAADGLTYGEMLIRLTVGNAPSPAALVSVAAADVTPTAVEWLWPGFLAFGTVAVLDGDPGLGKSTVALDLAARLSSGRPMPGGHVAGTAAALVASCEDSPEHTLRPRLEAAAADLTRVHLLLEATVAGGDRRGLLLPDDLELIERKLTATAARLLVIDPLMGFLGTDRHGKAIDANRDQSVRGLMSEFRRLAETTGACVVIVRHLNKNAGLTAMYRGGGSIGITGAARTALVVGKHPQEPDRRVVAVNKTNLGPRPLSATYGFGTGDVAAVAWGDSCEIWAEDLLAAAPTEAGRAAAAAQVPAVAAATDWLLTQLAGRDAAPAAEMIAAGEAAGFTASTLRRSRYALGVVTLKNADGWYWWLPAAM